MLIPLTVEEPSSVHFPPDKSNAEAQPRERGECRLERKVRPGTSCEETGDPARQIDSSTADGSCIVNAPPPAQTRLRDGK